MSNNSLSRYRLMLSDYFTALVNQLDIFTEKRLQASCLALAASSSAKLDDLNLKRESMIAEIRSAEHACMKRLNSGNNEHLQELEALEKTDEHSQRTLMLLAERLFDGNFAFALELDELRLRLLLTDTYLSPVQLACYNQLMQCANVDENIDYFDKIKHYLPYLFEYTTKAYTFFRLNFAIFEQPPQQTDSNSHREELIAYKAPLRRLFKVSLLKLHYIPVRSIRPAAQLLFGFIDELDLKFNCPISSSSLIDARELTHVLDLFQTCQRQGRIQSVNVEVYLTDPYPHTSGPISVQLKKFLNELEEHNLTSLIIFKTCLSTAAPAIPSFFKATELNSDTFKRFNRLGQLDLQGIALESLGADLFSSLQLRILKLDLCSVRTIDPNTFRGMQPACLRVLSLHTNNLADLHPDTFDHVGLVELESLFLQNNALSALAESLLKPLSNSLCELYLNQNRFEHAPPNLGQAKCLEYLHLSGNPFVREDTASAEELSQLNADLRLNLPKIKKIYFRDSDYIE